MEWLIPVAGPFLGGGLVSAVLVFVATRKRDDQADLAGRFDDASQLAQYIREEVERQVAPIRQQLETVKNESHEMNDAVRARETQLWLWDQKGRPGALPPLPTPILNRLGLGHIAEGWQTDPTPVPPGSSS